MKQSKRFARFIVIVLISMFIGFGSQLRPTTLALAVTVVPTRVASGGLELVLSKSTVQAGDAFDISVKLTIDSQSCGGQAGFTFDPKLVQIDSVDEGDFYKKWGQANGGDSIMVPSSVTPDNSQGIVPIQGISLMAGKCGPTGSGTMLIYHAKAKANGDAKFSLTNIKILDDGTKGNPRPYQGLQTRDLVLSIGGSGASVVQPTAKAAVVATSPGEAAIPTQEATAVKRNSNETDSSNGNSSFPWLILVPIGGVVVIGGVVFVTTRKKK